MFNRRRSRILLALLVLLTLVLITVDFRAEREGDGPLHALRRAASTVFGPLQDGLATLVRPIGNSVGSITGLFDAHNENARLREELAQVQERRVSFEDLLRENEELRTLLGIQARSTLEMVTAQVIGAGPSNFEWIITLDRGSSDGIRRDMPVISGAGLVGRVIQVTSDTSRVLLTIDPSFWATAHDATTGEVGMVRGNGSDPLVFEPMDPEVELSIGDELVTSSYSNGMYPSGIPIGTVTTVDDSVGFLTRSFQVRPWVDFTRLHTVMVVLHDPTRDLPGDDLGAGVWLRPDVDPSAPPPPDPPDATDDPTDGSTDDPTDGATDDPTDAPTDGQTDGDDGGNGSGGAP